MNINIDTLKILHSPYPYDKLVYASADDNAVLISHQSNALWNGSCNAYFAFIVNKINADAFAKSILMHKSYDYMMSDVRRDMKEYKEHLASSIYSMPRIAGFKTNAKKTITTLYSILYILDHNFDLFINNDDVLACGINIFTDELYLYIANKENKVKYNTLTYTKRFSRSTMLIPTDIIIRDSDGVEVNRYVYVSHPGEPDEYIINNFRKICNYSKDFELICQAYSDNITIERINTINAKYCKLFKEREEDKNDKTKKS